MEKIAAEAIWELLVALKVNAGMSKTEFVHRLCAYPSAPPKPKTVDELMADDAMLLICDEDECPDSERVEALGRLLGWLNTSPTFVQMQARVHYIAVATGMEF